MTKHLVLMLAFLSGSGLAQSSALAAKSASAATRPAKLGAAPRTSARYDFSLIGRAKDAVIMGDKARARALFNRIVDHPDVYDVKTAIGELIEVGPEAGPLLQMIADRYAKRPEGALARKGLGIIADHGHLDAFREKHLAERHDFADEDRAYDVSHTRVEQAVRNLRDAVRTTETRKTLRLAAHYASGSVAGTFITELTKLGPQGKPVLEDLVRRQASTNWWVDDAKDAIEIVSDPAKHQQFMTSLPADDRNR